MWSIDTREGLTLKITYKENEIQKIELLPIIIEDYSTPRWATNEEKMKILQKINLTSDVLMNNNE
jgi:hypothetical protein